MGCLWACFFGPRIVLFVSWLAGWLGPCFEGVFWPVMGFLFMPWTTLCYAGAVQACGAGNNFSGGWIILMLIAVIIDLQGTSKTLEKKSRATKS